MCSPLVTCFKQIKLTHTHSTHIYRHRLAYDNMCQNTLRHCLIWLLLYAWRQRKAFIVFGRAKGKIYSVCALDAKKMRTRHRVQQGTARRRKTQTKKLKRIQSDFPIFYFSVFVISFLVCLCSCCVAWPIRAPRSILDVYIRYTYGHVFMHARDIFSFRLVRSQLTIRSY